MTFLRQNKKTKFDRHFLNRNGRFLCSFIFLSGKDSSFDTLMMTPGKCYLKYLATFSVYRYGTIWTNDKPCSSKSSGIPSLSKRFPKEPSTIESVSIQIASTIPVSF